MEDLEIDCLVNIFQRLSIEDLIVGVPFVCRSWYKACLDPLCYKVLNFETLDFNPRSKFAKRYEAQYDVSVSSFSDFMKLIVHRSCELTNELRFPPQEVSINDLVFAATWCPRVKKVVIPELKPEVEIHIAQLVERWKNLEQLEIELKPSNFQELMEQINVNCKKFSKLKMSGSIEKRDALAIIEFLPKIKCMDLSRSFLQKELLVMIIKGCKELEILRVNGCVGFEVDKHVLEIASDIRIFEYNGSSAYDSYVYCNVDWNELFYPKF